MLLISFVNGIFPSISVVELDNLLTDQEIHHNFQIWFFKSLKFFFDRIFVSSGESISDCFVF